jgi:hypothetical protein
MSLNVIEVPALPWKGDSLPDFQCLSCFHRWPLGSDPVSHGICAPCAEKQKTEVGILNHE